MAYGLTLCCRAVVLDKSVRELARRGVGARRTFETIVYSWPCRQRIVSCPGPYKILSARALAGAELDEWRRHLR